MFIVRQRRLGANQYCSALRVWGNSFRFWQVGFDETMQRQRKTIEPEHDEHDEERSALERASASKRAHCKKATPPGPGVPEAPRSSVRSKTTSEIVHSMVATCRMYTCKPSAVSNPNAWAIEEAVIPPCPVSDTSNQIIGKALVSRIEELCFGMPLLEWFRAWSKLTTIVIIVFYNDGASSNRLLNKKLAEFFSCAIFAEHVLWFWEELCACHKLGRCAVTLFDRFGITGHMYPAVVISWVKLYKQMKNIKK